MTAEWKAYKGCSVAKVFPGYGDAPFKGKVEKVDQKEKRTPFYIRYEDDDSEWISFEELKRIVLDPPATEGPSAPTAAAAAAGGQASGQPADSSKKRSKGKKSGETAPAAAPPPGKKQKASSGAGAAAAGGAGTSTEAYAARDFDAEKAKRDLKTQADATQGMTQFTITAGAAQRATAAGGGSTASDAVAGTASDDGGAAAVGSGKATAARASKEGARKPAAAAAPPSSALQLPELLTEINRTANTTAQQLTQYRHTARLPYKGSGATMLPAMSQAVICGGQVQVSLYSTRRGGSQTPNRGVFDSPPQYQAEAEGVLAELDKVLKHARSNKAMLLKVNVTLRHMTDGLPDFKAAWDAWVDREALPVLTLREGAGPFNSSNITLEATALSDG